MKFSSKVEKCGQSPMRKFHPYAVAAKARGIKVYHLNIGQPDVQTPPAFFEAIRKFEQPVLEYAPSPGIPELIDAIKGYYDKLDMHFDKSEIYITTGGSEALAITLQCTLDNIMHLLDLNLILPQRVCMFLRELTDKFLLFI